jgi:3-hydroxyacyl-[acyl-carrier-protein] dehydratase
MTRSPRQAEGALELGSNVVELLIPQRRPMLMVDGVRVFIPGERPTLHATRHITANEIFFQGHFPHLHLWPGCLTIEGMGQASALLLAVHTIWASSGEAGPGNAGLDGLRNLERGFRLHPGYDAAAADHFRAEIARHAPGSFSVGASVDVKLLHPVFAGQRLDYQVTLTHDHGSLARFAVEALVGATTVARGVMDGARIAQGIAGQSVG